MQDHTPLYSLVNKTFLIYFIVKICNQRLKFKLPYFPWKIPLVVFLTQCSWCLICYTENKDCWCPIQLLVRQGDREVHYSVKQWRCATLNHTLQTVRSDFCFVSLISRSLLTFQFMYYSVIFLSRKDREWCKWNTRSNLWNY